MAGAPAAPPVLPLKVFLHPCPPQHLQHPGAGIIPRREPQVFSRLPSLLRGSPRAHPLVAHPGSSEQRRSLSGAFRMLPVPVPVPGPFPALPARSSRSWMKFSRHPLATTNNISSLVVVGWVISAAETAPWTPREPARFICVSLAQPSPSVCSAQINSAPAKRRGRTALAARHSPAPPGTAHPTAGPKSRGSRWM